MVRDEGYRVGGEVEGYNVRGEGYRLRGKGYRVKGEG